MRIASLALVFGCGAASLGQVTAPAENAQAPSPQAPAAAQPAEKPGPVAGFADVGALLTALESADAGVEKLSAELTYDRVMEIQGDTQTRRGTFYFRVLPTAPGAAKPAKPVRQLAARFDKFRVGSSLREEVKLFVFDGRYYAEKTPSEKRMVRREVVPPGGTFDPLKLGEGPLPIPIGQKKDEILKRYDAEMLTPDSGLDERAMKDFTAECVQLRLSPKPEQAEQQDMKEIRLWYRRLAASAGAPERLLLRMVKSVNKAGDESFLKFINVAVNADAKVPEDVMDTGKPPEEWDFQDQPFHGRAEIAPAKAPEGGGGVPTPATPEEKKPDGPK